MNQEDHDLLIGLAARLDGHILRFEQNLIEVRNKLDTYNQKIEIQQRFFYGCIGVIIFVDALWKFLK